MPDKAVHLFVMPGFADWEPAHAVAELRRHGGYRVEVVALAEGAVESMGGLTVRPTRLVADVDVEDVAVFILPGGDRWEQEALDPALRDLLYRLDAGGVPLAGPSARPRRPSRAPGCFAAGAAPATAWRICRRRSLPSRDRRTVMWTSPRSATGG